MRKFPLVDFVHKTWSLKSPEEKEIGLEKKVELYTIVRKWEKKKKKKKVCQYISIIDLKETRKHFLSETLLLSSNLFVTSKKQNHQFTNSRIQSAAKCLE